MDAPALVFQQFLARAVQATDARGGAIWLVSQRGAEAKSEFQLVAHVELESSLFHSDEQQHAHLTRQLGECVQTRKAIVSPPQPVAPEPGSLEAQLAQMQGKGPDLAGNRTPFPFFHIPLLLKEQIVGVLQMWLQPYVIPANYQEFVTFLTSLCSHVEQHLHAEDPDSHPRHPHDRRARPAAQCRDRKRDDEDGGDVHQHAVCEVDVHEA